jgi:hypothetical protein
MLKKKPLRKNDLSSRDSLYPHERSQFAVPDFDPLGKEKSS